MRCLVNPAYISTSFVKEHYQPAAWLTSMRVRAPTNLLAECGHLREDETVPPL